MSSVNYFRLAVTDVRRAFSGEEPQIDVIPASIGVAAGVIAHNIRHGRSELHDLARQVHTAAECALLDRVLGELIQEFDAIKGAERPAVSHACGGGITVPIIATAGDNKTYTPAPEGTHQAVCVDVIDQGMKPNPFKPGSQQHKIDVAWQIADLRDDGKRFVLFKRYTLSLNEKATLRHDLESWRGKVFTLDEEMGFDVESVIGANCLINVQHKPSTKDPNRIFANVVSVMPLIRGMAKLTTDNYARPTKEQEQQPEADTTSDELTVDDIPF